MIEFKVNGRKAQFDGANDTPLLWVLRDHLKMPGTRFGCGIGSCGACTVHLDGTAVRSCSLPVSAIKGAEILTIEGLAPNALELHPLQQAWIDEDVPQCGYCQAGQLMQAAELLQRNPNPSDAEISAHMTNICRCGTYVRIRKAIHRAAAKMTGGDHETS